jgi:hypothetical protein
MLKDEENVDNCCTLKVFSSKKHDVAIGRWKGRTNLSLMVSQIFCHTLKSNLSTGMVGSLQVVIEEKRHQRVPNHS